MEVKETCKQYLPALGLAAVAGLALAGDASAAMTSLIDFDTLATDIQPLLSSAVTKAAVIGAGIMAAVICWKFFRRFTQG